MPYTPCDSYDFSFCLEVRAALGRRHQAGHRGRRCRRGRGRWWRGGRHTGPGPLDVCDGGAHEPRGGPPPPSLHVAQRHRPKDEPHRAAAALTERLVSSSSYRKIIQLILQQGLVSNSSYREVSQLILQQGLDNSQQQLLQKG